MNSILKWETLLPVALLVIQSILLLFACLFVLRRLKILVIPYGGLEYSQLILGSSFLLGVFYISTADTTALFQTFKTYQNSGTGVLSHVTVKFGQFFLINLFFELLFALVSLFVVKLLFGFKNSLQEIEEGNIPAAMFMAVVNICLAIVFHIAAAQTIDFIVPVYVNFR